MPRCAPTTQHETQEVTKQRPAFVGHNLFDSDLALREAALGEGGDWVAAALSALGGVAVDHHIHDIAWTADRPGGHVAHAGLLALMTQAEARGAAPRLDAAAEGLASRFAGPVGEGDARRLVEDIALLLQGSLLVRHGPAEVADAFVASRLGGDWGRCLGTLPAGADIEAIARRQIEPLAG